MSAISGHTASWRAMFEGFAQDLDEPVADAADVLGDQHRPKLLQAGGRILERPQDQLALVDLQRQHLHVVSERRPQPRFELLVVDPPGQLEHEPNPLTGGPLDHKGYADTLREALAAAGIRGHIRPFHDGRHTAITKAAAAGVGAAARQARAGHADLATTQRYIDLAGVAFRDEALIAEQRMFGVESGVETQPTPTPETAI